MDQVGLTASEWAWPRTGAGVEPLADRWAEWCSEDRSAVAEVAGMASQPAAHRAGLRVACRVAERASSLADLQAARLAGHFDKRVAERLAEAWACQRAHFLDSEPAAQQVAGSGPLVV